MKYPIPKNRGEFQLMEVVRIADRFEADCKRLADIIRKTRKDKLDRMIEGERHHIREHPGLKVFIKLWNNETERIISGEVEA